MNVHKIEKLLFWVWLIFASPDIDLVDLVQFKMKIKIKTTIWKIKGVFKCFYLLALRLERFYWSTVLQMQALTKYRFVPKGKKIRINDCQANNADLVEVTLFYFKMVSLDPYKRNTIRNIILFQSDVFKGICREPEI